MPVLQSGIRHRHAFDTAEIGQLLGHPVGITLSFFYIDLAMFTLATELDRHLFFDDKIFCHRFEFCTDTE